MSEPPAGISSSFVVTKEYRRFAEFCDACRRYQYIGLCYGPPGVGKTVSAREYARSDLFEAHAPQGIRAIPPPEVSRLRTIFYTPPVSNSPRRIEREVAGLRLQLLVVTEAAVHHQEWHGDAWDLPGDLPNRIELLLVDETDRLKMPGLEQLRDIYDRHRMGLVLIGMPGIEMRLARFPQLYSRVGFVHQFRPLSLEEARFVLTEKWHQLGLSLQPDDFTDAEAVATILRITGGNFRLMQRLLTQIERILQINELHTVTKEVVETARESLVIGLA
jgi:DNA transposition AAA+ family ATPase